LKDFLPSFGCQLFTFPKGAYRKEDSGELKLYAFKMLEFYPLLSASDSACISYDSSFKVVLSNKSVFRTDEEAFHEKTSSGVENDELNRIYGD
jgi:elongation factor P--beta-lysine ligase